MTTEQQQPEPKWINPEGEEVERAWGPRWAMWNFEAQQWDKLPAEYNPHHERCDCPVHIAEAREFLDRVDRGPTIALLEGD